MASIIKRGDKWRVSVNKNGRRRTATFKSKTEARLWANQIELELEEIQSEVPFLDVLERYKTEVSAKKGGHQHDVSRLKTISQAKFANKFISNITPNDIAVFRDELCDRMKPNSVLRILGVASNIFTVATNEWGLVQSNPCSRIRKPSPDKPRNRRISPQEIRDIVQLLLSDSNDTEDILGLLRVTGTRQMTEPKRKRFAAATAFVLAIETGMRLGELTELRKEDVSLEKRVAFLRQTKNGDSRSVPLSLTAVELLKPFSGTEGLVFNVNKTTLRKLFAVAVKALGIKNLHFHDTRHEAVTRLSKKLNVLELARVVGHRNISQLMTYYNESAENIAKKL